MNRVRIEALDNPGWLVRVDQEKTDLVDRPFAPVRRGAVGDPDGWICLKVENGQFIGSGGPGQLEAIVAAFVAWAEGG